jgi:RHS repeat-associated protein
MGLYNSAGQVVNQYKYKPFGEPTQTTEGVANSLRFASQQYDAKTGLYLMSARWYDPALQRFVSEDPIGILGGINTYAYAGNDPVNFSDPSGLSTGATCVGGVSGSGGNLSLSSKCDAGNAGPPPGPVTEPPPPSCCENKNTPQATPSPAADRAQRQRAAAERIRRAREEWYRECVEHAQDANDRTTLVAGEASGVPFAIRNWGKITAVAGTLRGAWEVVKRNPQLLERPSSLVGQNGEALPATATALGEAVQVGRAAAPTVAKGLLLYEVLTASVAGPGSWLSQQLAKHECRVDDNAW